MTRHDARWMFGGGMLAAGLADSIFGSAWMSVVIGVLLMATVLVAELRGHRR